MDIHFLTLGIAQLNRLFPYFLILDANMDISHIGEVLKNSGENSIGENFFDHFDGIEQHEISSLQNSGTSTTISSRFSSVSIIGKWEELSPQKLYLFAGEKLLENYKQPTHELISTHVVDEEPADVKEMFLATMSHEIRTPMNAIISMSNQLSQTPLSNDQDYYLQTIQTASKKLLEIIDDMLEVSALNAGQLQLELIGFDLSVILSEVMQMVEDDAQKKGLAIAYQLPEDPVLSPILIGDPYRIKQVVENLMSNAVKFTESGSVRLTVSVLNEEPDEQEIEIVVTDTGIGMAPEFISRLFDSFSQEYESVSREYGGTGLGMSISRKLADEMGGHFKVESEKGVGSTISFLIKLQKGSSTDLPQLIKRTYDEELFAGRRILIVDDNEMNRLVATTILLNCGAQVLNAEDGQMALNMVKEDFYDIILMDIQMPVLDGYETTRTLRRQQYTGRIIALTASVAPGEREKCIAAGMNDYLTKPIDEDLLIAVVGGWMESKEAVPLPEPEVAAPLYNLEGLRVISKGREDFVTRMIEMFCQQVPEALSNLNACFQQNDLAQVSKLAHKLKSTVDHLEIKSIQRTIRNIETLSEDHGSREELTVMVDEINAVLNRVIESLQLEIKLRNE